MNTLSTISGIQARIFHLPNRPPFMTASDLAEVYGTSVKALNQAVSRNPARFPEDFCFVLTEAETEGLRSQNVTANPISNKVRYAPTVCTHGGGYALSAVLKTSVAAEVSVIIHRAFAAMEQKALDEANFLLAKLQKDSIRFKAARFQVRHGMDAGYGFEAIWMMGSISRPKLALAAHECLALGLIKSLPQGTPEITLPVTVQGYPGLQMDMFSHG